MISKDSIKDLMTKVNDYWIKENPKSGNCAWERGAYMIGNIAAYETTQKREYLDYAIKWANDNNWSFYDNGSDDTWKNADNKICGQSYLRLMELVPGCGTADNMLKSMEMVLNDPDTDYWWWVDTIYMALPFYNMMGVKFNDERYFDKVHALYINSKVERNCYDDKEGLWYRDERFLPGRELAPLGNKIFWGRGNGWIIAGLARTLEILPKTNKYYNEYLEMFKTMAKALLPWQQQDGFWRTNIKEPKEFDYPETSATVLILYAYMLGVNLGILDKDYYNAVEKGFKGLNETAVFETGKIGYVQVVAWGPGPVNPNASNDYAVGTYLLLCSEIIKYSKNF